MSADRYEITCDDDVATVTAPGGVTDSFSRHGTSSDRFGYGAIRQQARDMEQLRAELAAAVAERDRLRIDLRDCELVLRMEHEISRERRARLAAIDAAPTVATVVAHADESGMWPALDYEDEDLPPIGTHLIARPAKD